MRLIDADALIDKIKAKATEMFTVDSVYEYYINALIDVEDIIKAQPTADVVERKRGEWISCSERLPEEDGHYLVYAPCYFFGSSSGKENHNGIMFSKYKNGKWSIEHGYYQRPNCVKAWMPLLEPYEEGEKE